MPSALPVFSLPSCSTVSSICLKQVSRWPLLRPAVGGCIIIGLVYLLGDVGLSGVKRQLLDPHAVTISSCFKPNGAKSDWSWWWKILYRHHPWLLVSKVARSPLCFFIGASLGNLFARRCWMPSPRPTCLPVWALWRSLPVPPTTPLVGTIMGIELFGSGAMIHDCGGLLPGLPVQRSYRHLPFPADL